MGNGPCLTWLRHISPKDLPSTYRNFRYFLDRVPDCVLPRSYLAACQEPSGTKFCQVGGALWRQKKALCHRSLQWDVIRG